MNVKALRKREPQNPAMQRYLDVAHILTGDESATIEDGIEWLDTIRAELQIPPLASYGITTKDIPQIVEKSKNSSSMKGNPILLTEKEMSEILLQAL
jgi:alcohol dehydrogenase class IV